MPHQRFIEVVESGVLSLPQDLKAALRVVEDADMEEKDRIAVAGAILHALSGSNAIPGMRGILAHVGDVLVLRVVLKRALNSSNEAMELHKSEAPELYEELDQALEVANDYLGDLMKVIESAADGVSKSQHQGHTASQCVRDTEVCNWLYDAVSEAVVEQLEFDEEEVAREVRHVDRILPHLRTRLAAGTHS